MASRKTREGKGKAYSRGRAVGRGGPGCLSFILLALFVVAAIAATIAIFFKINRIDVTGNVRYSPEEIRTASGVEQGDNLLLFNKFEAISSIFTQLPYMDEIRMSRDLPDTLLIEVKECTAAAYIYDGNGYWLLSSKGKLLEQQSKLTDTGLIEVTGAVLIGPEVGKKADLGAAGRNPQGTDTSPDSGDKTDKTGANALRADTLSDTLTAIAEGGIAADVDSVDVTKVYNVEFSYLGRFRVKLGMPEDLGYKIDFLKKEEVVESLEKNAKGVIDLSELIEKGVGRFIPE